MRRPRRRTAISELPRAAAADRAARAAAGAQRHRASDGDAARRPATAGGQRSWRRTGPRTAPSGAGVRNAVGQRRLEHEVECQQRRRRSSRLRRSTARDAGRRSALHAATLSRASGIRARTTKPPAGPGPPRLCRRAAPRARASRRARAAAAPRGRRPAAVVDHLELQRVGSPRARTPRRASAPACLIALVSASCTTR